MIGKSLNPLQNCILWKHIMYRKIWGLSVGSLHTASKIWSNCMLSLVTGKSFLKEGSYCCSCESNTDCLKFLTTGGILVQFIVLHKLLITFSAQFHSFFDLNKSFLKLIDFCADVIAINVSVCRNGSFVIFFIITNHWT